MRYLICLLILAGPLVAAPLSWGQQVKYIVDFLQVTVRSGPSPGNKVIRVLKTGDNATVIKETASGWANIRLEDGLEGWMLSRYLMEGMPAVVRLNALSPKSKEQSLRLGTLTKRNQELSTQVSSAKRRAQEAERALSKLKAASRGVLDLQARHKALSAKFKTTRNKLAEQSTELESMRFSTNLKWFLAGAGVLVIGWVMGFAFGRARRRRPSLY